ncbi:glycosyl transferase group 1 [Rhizobium sp. PDO1-076]|uniref:glycosyltransferase family 4 protein n=1 Tax=Rhizobium sp. PDO1-076 TaxID=1125979 RepID=UPI00024E2564|nr:glycosyltransferase family 4 protein [Rhizobium sp. PDO1-076]EHS53129.1 glycosyl transferase group 1 [Rhizobium sp. PDO1-076]
MVNLPRTQTRIAFIVTEDWFFVSHFLPMLRAAKEVGLDVIVVTRVGKHRHVIENLGARVVPLNIERGHLGPMSVASSIGEIAQTLRTEKIDIVHCIALRAVVTGGLAALVGGIRGKVLAVTGGGLLAADTGIKARAGRFAIRILFRLIRSRGTNHFLFENISDPPTFGIKVPNVAVTVVGGAGVDPNYYTPLPPHPGKDIKIAIVSRMVWSKGADLAVKAVSIARERGHDVSLSLFGTPDPSNPRSLSTETLNAWSNLPGINWRGSITDVREVWAEHDICCMPTRGGEGLPRSILEAAACGRPVLTTNVPGCRDFVRNGCEGWLVPVDNAAALADQICALALDKESVHVAGNRARQRVIQGFTEAIVMEQVRGVYRDISKAISGPT